jgi:alcohol dehydrogenase class IV
VTRDFTWQDGERLIRFGRGALADAPDLLGSAYALLSTERARALAPSVADGAATTIDVGPGRVDDLAGDLLDTVRATDTELLVALGGGRVIDVAKAIASALGDRRVAAIPTTLSAAEMTPTHRRARGAAPDTPGVRPAIVVNDPALCASQPEPGLAASAANALAHAIEGPLTPLSSPVPALAAREAVRLIAGAWAGGEPDRDALALAALLAGYTIGSTHYGLHHVAAQTLVRLGGAGHGPANAVLLPHTVALLRERFPAAFEELAVAIGADPAEVAADLARRAGAVRLRDMGVDESALDACAQAAAERPDLAMTPPPAGVEELRALYASAW